MCLATLIQNVSCALTTYFFFSQQKTTKQNERQSKPSCDLLKSKPHKIVDNRFASEFGQEFGVLYYCIVFLLWCVFRLGEFFCFDLVESHPIYFVKHSGGEINCNRIKNNGNISIQQICNTNCLAYGVLFFSFLFTFQPLFFQSTFSCHSLQTQISNFLPYTPKSYRPKRRFNRVKLNMSSYSGKCIGIRLYSVYSYLC